MILRTLSLALLTIGSIAAFSVHANAQFDSCSTCDQPPLANQFGRSCSSNSCGDWYAGLLGGWVGGTKNSFSGEGVGTIFGAGNFEEEFSSDSGFGIGAVLGRRFANGFRLEADFIFRHQDLDSVTDEFGLGEIGSADVSTFALNWNVAYDFRRGNKFNPYVGVGTGLYLVDAEASGVGGVADQEVGLAFPSANLQWFAGVSSPINERAEWFVEYRGLTTYGIDVSAQDGPDSASFRSSSYHSSVFSGIRINLR